MDIDEKRVYDATRDGTVAYVATASGLASVALSGDQVGRFGLVGRDPTRDVATDAEGRVYAATDEDVLTGPEAFDGTGFGGAVAVSVADVPVAADASGRVARYADGAWSTLGSVAGVSGMDGDLVAATDGVYRVGPDGLFHVGLDDVRDVAAGGPLAATGDGLYRLGNGWQRVLDGSFTTVAAGDGRAHAATADRLYASGGGGWQHRTLPVEEPVADVAYGDCAYVVTEPGTLLVDADASSAPDGVGGWRSRSLGLPGVAAMALR